jgi:DNA-binding Xre family transcriptional regulator
MSVQIIRRDGKPEWAVIPYETYVKMVDEAEMLQCVREYDAAKAALESGDEELIPSEVVYAVMDGDNPIKVWREHRQMTGPQLAEAVGIDLLDLSEIETGQRVGTTETLTAIAGALRVSLDEIVGVPGSES